MNILYTCDNNYVWLMGISMISLFKNNETLKDIHVYLLGTDISHDNKKLLKSIAKDYKRECTIIDMPEVDIPKKLISTRWPRSAFNRLYAAKILPCNVKKILYLDCDIIVLNSLKYIETTKLDEYPIYGVKDCISKGYKKNIGLRPESPYINGGVLLLNIEKLRNIDISKKMDNFLKKYEKCIHYADQDILNGTFKDEIGVLPPEYDVMTLEYMYTYKEIKLMRKPSNYYTEREINNAVNNPCIVHFTTNLLNIRPWYKNSNHPKAKDFIKYLKISPWADKELEEMRINTKNKKNAVFKILNKFPKKIELRLLGFIHSNIYPKYIKIKSKF